MSNAHRGLVLSLAVACVGLAWPETAAAQYFPYFRPGRRYATVIGGPIGPAPLDPYSVAAYWGFLPAPIVARQAIGHQIIWTSPNGYVYRPVYPDQDPSGAGPSDGFSVLPGAPTMAANAPNAAPVVRPANPAVDIVPANPPGMFDIALLLFRTARYDEALGRLDQILLTEPENGQAELLSAQALFAQGEYPGAVAALDRATKLLPEEEWDRYVANYRDFFPSALRYAVHLRTLERYVDQFPESAESRLLLAYHYGSLGFNDQALAQLRLMKPTALSRRLAEHFARQRKPVDDELPAPAPDPDLELNGPQNASPAGDDVRNRANWPVPPIARRVGPREF